MKLRIFNENKEQGQITFALENEVNHTRELIVVNYNVEDPILAYKKGLIADFLYITSELQREVSWKFLDTEIANIMNTKIHMI